MSPGPVRANQQGHNSGLERTRVSSLHQEAFLVVSFWSGGSSRSGKYMEAEAATNARRVSKNKEPETYRLAVGIAEVDTGLVAPGFGQFAFLLFVFGELLIGVGERVARSEHGVGLGGESLLLT